MAITTATMICVFLTHLMMISFTHAKPLETALSGLGVWVDPDTPADRQMYTSSRGDRWELVMSDEFNTKNRSFRPGDDHLWTSLEKPDGVNHALEIYSHNMTTTACDDDGTCYFQIEVRDEVTNLTIWNDYIDPPGFQEVNFFYRAAMVQSWNKFCFQGGMVEVRAQLPGAVSEKSGNPDLQGGKTARAQSSEYYPTWPGIWMMGNLGRALFSASTNRMWPYSYDRCDPDVFEPSNQRISACDGNPGHGLNPNQGRGAPEIDILEGGAVAISSSIQLGPGMPKQFRTMIADKETEGPNGYEWMICMYTDAGCLSPGANQVDVPTDLYYNTRKHKSWYQGLRYASNNFCQINATEIQSYEKISTSLDKGITVNKCNIDVCPASFDVNSDLSEITPGSGDYWGINSNGTCFPVINNYMGSYLCSPANPAPECKEDDLTQAQISQAMKSGKIPFNYQMDAISSNWPVHLAAYVDYITYQLEWVPGPAGYTRWMINGEPIFEIPAEAITNPPQDETKSNPIKLNPEEPMYLIFNVALSSTWGATPPNSKSDPPRACTDPVGLDAATVEKNQRICGDFPMYMKIDYIRVYQDTSASSKMAIGCDPSSHPTKQWILDHIDEFQDPDNLAIDVSGGAFCHKDDDCTARHDNKANLATGVCQNKRCRCLSPVFWGGPRCTYAVTAAVSATTQAFGPSMEFAWSVASLVFVGTIAIITHTRREEGKRSAFASAHGNFLAAKNEIRLSDQISMKKDIIVQDGRSSLMFFV